MAGRKHRGVSVGTIVMLLMTCAVVVSLFLIMPKLSSNVDVTIDTGKVLQALSLGDAMPELSLSDIPIALTVTSKSPAATDKPLTVLSTKAPAATATPTLAPTPVPTATPVPGGSFTMTFGGSVIVDNDLRKAHYFSESKKYDFSDVLSLLREEMQADMTVVALENIIAAESKLSDVNAPADILPMLSNVGVDAVSLGYRNAYDLGLNGLNSTISAAQATGMSVLGAYADDASSAADKRIVELGGVKVALLHYTDVLSDKGKKAMKKDGGSYALPLDAVNDGADAILADIAAVRQQGAQVVAVTLNWSAASGKSAPTKKQIAFAQQLADAGADIIVGSGSRVIQPVTWLTGTLADGSTKQVLCAYSLGSLLNSSRTNANVAGMLLHLDVAFDGTQVSFREVRYTPTYIWRFKQDGRYYYRVVDSSAVSPDGMSDSQIESKERAFKNAQKYLGDEPAATLKGN